MALLTSSAIFSTSLFSSHTYVHASVTTQIALPSGYTAKKVIQADQNKQTAINHLKSISRRGMLDNKFSDTDNADQREVDVIKMNSSDQRQIAKYALAVINSARRQLHRPAWKYSDPAMHFAQRVAKHYYLDNASIYDPDHDVHAILLAAKKSGLNSNLGQVYEDEAGLPTNNL